MSGRPQPFPTGREGPLSYLARQIQTSRMHEEDKRHVLIAIRKVRSIKTLTDIQAMDLRIQLSAYGESLRVYRRMAQESVDNKAYQSCVVAYYKLVQILRNQRSDRKMQPETKGQRKQVPTATRGQSPDTADGEDGDDGE